MVDALPNIYNVILVPTTTNFEWVHLICPRATLIYLLLKLNIYIFFGTPLVCWSDFFLFSFSFSVSFSPPPFTSSSCHHGEVLRAAMR